VTMPKKETFQDLALTPPKGEQELWRWLYTELRAAILSGRLKPGARLPSTRSLAKQHSLSRGTVVAAFDQLLSEGYIRTQVSSGTYVAPIMPDRSLQPSRSRSALTLPVSKATLSKHARAMIHGIDLLGPGSRCHR